MLTFQCTHIVRQPCSCCSVTAHCLTAGAVQQSDTNEPKRAESDSAQRFSEKIGNPVDAFLQFWNIRCIGEADMPFRLIVAKIPTWSDRYPYRF